MLSPIRPVEMHLAHAAVDNLDDLGFEVVGGFPVVGGFRLDVGEQGFTFTRQQVLLGVEQFDVL